MTRPLPHRPLYSVAAVAFLFAAVIQIAGAQESPSTPVATPTPVPPTVIIEPLEDADRWRIDHPLDARYEKAGVRGNGLSPYRQNKLKGDLPIGGQNTFLILTILSETF